VTQRIAGSMLHGGQETGKRRRGVCWDVYNNSNNNYYYYKMQIGCRPVEVVMNDEYEIRF
jgi:hypothetical protein